MISAEPLIKSFDKLRTNGKLLIPFVVSLSNHIQTREPLIKSFDKLRTNGKLLIPFVVSLSNHTQIRLTQSFLGLDQGFPGATSIATALLCAAVLVGTSAVAAEPLTREQGDAILQELKQIRQLLEKPPQRPAAPAAVAAPAPEKVTIKLGQEYAIGPSGAPVAIIEFNDLQCPFCNRFHTGAFADIRKHYVDTGKVRFINRDMPLEDIHPQAVRASHAARCAGEQGKYWEVAESLITHQAGMSPQSIDQHAKQTGLEASAYQSCMDSNRYVEAIRASGAAARALGISGTPSFVIGRVDGDTVVGQKLVGAVPFATFETVIKGMLGAQ